MAGAAPADAREVTCRATSLEGVSAESDGVLEKSNTRPAANEGATLVREGEPE